MSSVQRIPATSGSAVALNVRASHPAQGISHRDCASSVTQKRSSRLRHTTSAASRRRNRLVTTASYSADNYGPMGGDARIKVIGVGGGGGNAVNRMISSGLQVCS